MSRPQKNNANYFSHDNNMRNDRKIRSLITEYGLEGYAIWNMLLEILTEADNLQIPNTDLEITLIAGEFGIAPDRFRSMLKSMQTLGLIELDEYIICPKLLDRLQELFDKREYWRARKQASKDIPSGKPDFPTVFHMENPSSSEFSQVKTPQTKLNKTKQNKTSNKGGDFIDKLVESFKSEYEKSRGIEYIAEPKDRKAVGRLLGYYKKATPDRTSEEAFADLTSFFKSCLSIKDQWLAENITLSLISSRINEIRAKLKGVANGRSGASISELASVVDGF